MQQARCAYSNHWIRPSDVPDDERIRQIVMLETSWGCLIYGYCAAGRFDIHNGPSDDELDKPITSEVALRDGISLSMGLLELQPKHERCSLLICPCKVV